jgi:hypothetical protein
VSRRSIAGSRAASPATAVPGLDPLRDGGHAIDVKGDEMLSLHVTKK